MENTFKAITSFGFLFFTVVFLAKIPVLRASIGVDEGKPRVIVHPSTSNTSPSTATGDFDPQKLRQWDAVANGRTAIAENGRLTIAGKSYKTITNEFTPKGTFVIGKPYSARNGGFLSYPVKVVFTRDMNPPARQEFLKNGTRLGDVSAYAIHAGNRSNGCVVLSARDMNEVSPSLEGTTITIR